MAEAKLVPIERQKLIHSGRVLENEKQISETALKEGDFVILMVITPKPISSSNTTGLAAKPLVSGSEKSATSNIVNFSTVAESKLVTGTDYEEAIGRMVDMGFDRNQVIAAMRASFNNPERAVEYLTSGILPNVAGPEDSEVDSTTENIGDEEGEGEGEDEDHGDLALSEGEDDNEEQSEIVGGTRPSRTGQTASRNSGMLEFLRHDPQFQQLRSLIHQNPEMLGPIIEQISQTSPEFLQLIEQNREEFYSLLINEEEVDNGGTGPTAGELGEGAQILQVTEEEQAAITRLEGMGFDRARVIEAFFACDKNEELAANYLLEHINDD